VSVFLVLQFCALKLIFKLISIADFVPSFELVRRRKYSVQAIFTATVAVNIASALQKSYRYINLALHRTNP